MRGDDDKRFIVKKDGQDHGPFARTSLIELARGGEIESDHLVVDTRTKEARPAHQWAAVKQAIEDRARAQSEAEAQAARARMQRRERVLAGARAIAYALLALSMLAAIATLAYEAGAAIDGRVAGLTALLVLGLGGLVAYVERDGSTASEAAFRSEPSASSVWVLGGLSLAVAAPLLALAPYVSLAPSAFGEEVGQAQLAVAMARDGLARGWISEPLAGIPFGLHEPCLTSLLVRGLLALGLSPLGATHLLGTLAALLAPPACFIAGLRGGLRPAHALAGAAMGGWVAASTPFAGGFEGFFAAGLLGPALVTPLCALTVGEIFEGQTRWSAPALATAAMLVDPSLAIATLLATSVAALVAWRSDAIRQTVRTVLASGLVAGAVYGHGLARLQLPFGAPAALSWRLEGFPYTRLLDWILEGQLLDANRAPISTYLAGAAVLALALQVTRPAARGALAALTTALLWPIVARLVLHDAASPLATSAVALLVPSHAIAIAPLAAAATLAIALEESVPRLSAMVDQVAPELDRVAGLVFAAALTLAVLVPLRDRIAYVERTRDVVTQRRDAACGPLTPEGYDHATVAAALASLEGGRLAYAPDALVAAQCAELDALALESAVPVAPTSGVGTQAGVLWLAFTRLEPARSGASARAEALGVRHLLDDAGTSAAAPWSREAEASGLALLTHTPRTTLVGAGCAVRTWRGTDDALRERLAQELETPEGTDRVLSPTELVVLEHAAGPLAELELAHDDCDPSRATVTERPREAGALEADVSTATPIDLVFRVTAFASWSVLVDGSEAHELRLVAPGFLSVRLPPGRHHVVARAQGVPWFWSTLLVAGLLALLVAAARREWFERKVLPPVERADPWRRRG